MERQGHRRPEEEQGRHAGVSADGRCHHGDRQSHPCGQKPSFTAGRRRPSAPTYGTRWRCSRPMIRDNLLPELPRAPSREAATIPRRPRASSCGPGKPPLARRVMPAISIALGAVYCLALAGAAAMASQIAGGAQAEVERVASEEEAETGLAPDGLAPAAAMARHCPDPLAGTSSRAQGAAIAAALSGSVPAPAPAQHLEISQFDRLRSHRRRSDRKGPLARRDEPSRGPRLSEKGRFRGAVHRNQHLVRVSASTTQVRAIVGDVEIRKGAPSRRRCSPA